MNDFCKMGLVVATGLVLATCNPPSEPATATAPSTTATATSAPASSPSAAATTSAGATAASTAGTQTQAAKPIDAGKLDERGYIRQWLILAPIHFGDDYNAEEIDKEQIPGEANLTPKAGDKQKVKSHEQAGADTKEVDKELSWQPVVTEDYFFDINEMLGLDSSESVGGYAVAYLDVPQDMSGITFSLCSNDDGVVYLNGKNVYTFVGGRGIAEDTDTVEDLTLHKGINTVIFKVWNDANAWQGCIRLLTKDGKPVSNVGVRLSK